MFRSGTKTLICVDTQCKQCWNQFAQQYMYGSLVYHFPTLFLLSHSFLSFLPPPLSLLLLLPVVNISVVPTNVSLVEQLQQLTFQLFKEGTAVRDVQVIVSTQSNSAQGMYMQI